MKRSKLFLSATTCLLGIAALAAGRARHNGTAVSLGCTINGTVRVSVTCFTKGLEVRSHNNRCKIVIHTQTSTAYTCIFLAKTLYTQAE